MSLSMRAGPPGAVCVSINACRSTRCSVCLYQCVQVQPMQCVSLSMCAGPPDVVCVSINVCRSTRSVCVSVQVHLMQRAGHPM